MTNKSKKVAKKSYYTRKLDAWFSKRIRSIGRCERCGKTDGKLECAHIVSRRNRTLRWDENNALCLCVTDHFWGHQDPLGFSLFIEKTFPKKYKYIMLNKNKITKRSAGDLKELLEANQT